MAKNGGQEVCCPKFDPAPWDGTERTWDKKAFVKDRVRCLCHIPINFAGVMKRNIAKIQAAEAMPGDEMIVLSDNKSLWSSDVYLAVGKDVPDAEMATLSGTFLTKVFEGPYSREGVWMREMGEYVASEGKTAKRMLTYYTTCPKCAKKYGKNYVVLLAEV